MDKSLYQSQIINRSTWRYYLGVIPRLKKHLYCCYVRRIAIKKGAFVGRNTVLPLSLAKKANYNLVIGDNCSIQSDNFDLRSPIKIGNNVIIGSEVEILTCSHNIDSEEWEFKSYGIVIEDFAWVATRVFILPSCRNIGRGSVSAAGSVIIKNIEPMSVVSGNPAIHLRFRSKVHSKLVVESLLGADYNTYINTRRLYNETSKNGG